jgi:hypothetical protein
VTLTGNLYWQARRGHELQALAAGVLAVCGCFDESQSHQWMSFGLEWQDISASLRQKPGLYLAVNLEQLQQKEPMRRPRAGGRQGVGSRTAWHRQAGEGLVTKASSRLCPKATTSPARLPNPARRRFLHANGQATSWVKNRKLGRICRRFDLVC